LINAGKYLWFRLEIGQSVVAPYVIQMVLIFVSIYRFTELVRHILKKGN